ncbi:MAG TPA: hypothetical protein VK829_09985 [Terriglobales bacterium]|jgi:hypothetical protein|nr:hypothetical protein [Terriglobales bacterium]
MDSDVCAALRRTADAFFSFRTKFGVELSFSNLCEIYVALQLGLPMPRKGNTKGFDLQGSDGARYQVKGRDASVLNVDINNFDFDYMVLVNLSDDYRPLGMWKLEAETIRASSAERGKFHKYQLTQKAFKQAAVPIDIGLLRASLTSEEARA